ncbi:MAG: glutamate--tRNA ligase family protein [Bacteroidota bacterium]
MPYTRIAPTPSGYLHRGNAHNFLLIQRLAQEADGDILLRIDDIDRGRYRREFVQDIFDSLEWLGIEYQYGPRSVEEFETNWSQHLRLDRYYKMLDALREKNLVYPCKYSRNQIQQMTSGGIYRGENRDSNLSLDDEGVAWRIDVPKGHQINIGTKESTHHIDVYQSMGHFVVRKKDGLPAYQIASLSDDIEYGIELIVRGVDLMPSTAAQLYLADCLDTDFRRWITFHHHPLVLSASGEKLSKSAGSESLLAQRQAGLSPNTLF